MTFQPAHFVDQHGLCHRITISCQPRIPLASPGSSRHQPYLLRRPVHTTATPVVGSSTSMLRAICVSQVLGPTYSLSEQWHLLAWGSGGPGNIQIRRTLHLFIPCQDLTSWITDLPTLMDAAAWPLPQRSLTVYPPWFCLLCSLPPGSHNDILPLFDF